MSRLIERPKLLCSHRLSVIILTFLIITTCYMIRVDVNVTLLSMVNFTRTSNDSGDHIKHLCPDTKSEEPLYSERVYFTGSYSWDSPTQGHILGAFYWGYIFTQILGGILSLRYGPKWLGALCITGSAILDLGLPAAAALGPIYLIILRIVQGLCQGMLMPVVGCLVGRWIPLNERSRATAFSMAGCQIGTILGQVISGLFAQPRPVLDRPGQFVSKWQYVHYCFGLYGITIAVIWCLVVYDSPERHPRISPEELTYLRRTLKSHSHRTCRRPEIDRNNRQSGGSVDEKQAFASGLQNAPTNLKSENPCSDLDENRNPVYGFFDVPWKQLLRSAPFWSVLICNVTTNWSWFTMITCMPTYMSRVLGFSLEKNGLLSSMPYLAQSISAQLVAYASDIVITRQWMSVTWVRKLNNTVSMGGMGLGMLIVGLIGCNHYGAVATLVLSIGILGAASSGFCTNCVDLAPNYAGVIISLTNTVASLPGIVGPLFVGYITKNSSTQSDWLVIFGVCAGVIWLGTIFNLFATSGDLQPWADNKRES